MSKKATKTNKKRTLNRASSGGIKRSGEQPADTVALDEDVGAGYRDYHPEEDGQHPDSRKNWSQPEDRGDQLMDETDPFVNQPERDTQLPPELVQERAYRLYEQRGGGPDDNLADWFEAERQLRNEHSIPGRKQ